ncbi:acetylcholinesterase isoform X1 [Megalopta genalis]|uniref:acetylcholinesterase isoform X1 n=1 Tax=Megalopta genalis TaxID=115081 RepID=UPI003FD2BD06
MLEHRIRIAILLLASSRRCLAEDLPRTDVVRTASGPVRGVIKETVWNSVEYSAFLGIPYAEPPLANLRFKPPVPISPWNEVLDAVEEGNACPQIDFFTARYTGNEDCLYLNVFTRHAKVRRRAAASIFESSRNLRRRRKFRNGTGPRPVMVWIYGGAYLAGYSNASFYGPDFFLEEDVVFVSFNYRIGALGFLSLDHPDALGNAGLKDQHLVLQWVQKNIAAFGGNPREVTIFGESAGAASVGFHILSERSIGLFHRSIGMSGTPLCQWAYHTPAEAYRSAAELAQLLGKAEITKSGLLELLRDVPADALVNQAMKLNLNDLLPFRPTIEDPAVATDDSAFMTECPIRKYLTGNFTQHPMMMGRTHDEALFFLDDYVGSPSDRAKTMSKWLGQVTNIDEILTDRISDAMAFNLDQTSPEFLEQILTMLTDVFFTAPIDLTQRIVSRWNSGYPIYYYRLSYTSTYSVHSLVGQTVKGTSHVDDIGDLFNVASLNAPTDPKHPFNIFRRKMVRLWTNFAKQGDPTPKVSSRRSGEEFDVIWTDSTESGMQLDIKEESVMRPRLVDYVAQTYEEALFARLPFQSACIDLSLIPLGIFKLQL